MRAPYRLDDDSRAWAENFRVDEKLKPGLVLRIATDTNYVLNQTIPLSAYSDGAPRQTKSMMNVAMPGMRLPHVLNWQANESLDNPVQTASFELLNVLQITTGTQTTLGGSGIVLNSEQHNRTIAASYVGNSLGVVEEVPGNVNVTNHTDQDGYYFKEEDVKYRRFMPQTFPVTSMAGFPDPLCPNDEDGADVELAFGYELGSPISNSGVGNYFVLIDQEVIRVSKLSSNTFTVLPGGRMQNGVIQNHTAGATVTLLGYGPQTGEYTAYGYLAIDDFKPYKNILRPGTAIVSYEGYGNMPSTLTHAFDASKNYCFTGYWFVKGLESSLGDDGIPRLRVDLVSAGEMFNKQQITPDLVQRIKTQFGQWHVNGQTIFGAANHDRNIPGDWVDYNQWDPRLSGSYPLKIKTEFAQHKEFFQHMRDTNTGIDCEFCQQERKEWLTTHQDPDTLFVQYQNMPTGAAKDALGQRIEDLKLVQARAIGRHIYKQSIRVLREEAGPVKTYIRLMATMAAAAWDHPAYGTQLAQSFSKIPNKLFDNIRDIGTGLIYNGQVDFQMASDNTDYDWSRPTYDDQKIISRRSALACPFESTYDKTPFFQPMQDLADVNGNTFWIDRYGRPVFMPRNFPLRPYGLQTPEKYEYFLKYGGSISAYSHNLDTEQINTQCWVTATTAFDSEFTVSAAGTGFKGGNRIISSPLAGNQDGLALTSGVQQVGTVSMDNQALGLSWDTNPAGWGLEQVFDGNTITLNAKPPLYDGSPEIGKGTSRKQATIYVQKTINFFLIRRYLPAISFNNKAYYTIWEDGNYGDLTEEALNELQDYLIAQTPTASIPLWPGITTALASKQAIQTERNHKNYGRATYYWVNNWLNKIATNYIQTDIWWYVMNGRQWEEYVGAVTGVKVPVNKSKNISVPSSTSKKALSEPLYIIDDKGLQQALTEWHRTFAKTATNVGNRTVDDSINKASVRSLSTNYADPRIQPGDILWCEIPGFLQSSDVFGRIKPPFTNGVYVTTISRQLDLLGGTYTASYSGYRYRGTFGTDTAGVGVNAGYDFIRSLDA